MQTTTRTAASTTTYTKLRDGSWGIRGRNLTAGHVVIVAKRDGSTKQEMVSRIVWTGDDGTQIAAINPAARTCLTETRSRQTARRMNVFGEYTCDECGDRVTPGSRCWETGMRH